MVRLRLSCFGLPAELCFSSEPFKDEAKADTTMEERKWKHDR